MIKFPIKLSGTELLVSIQGYNVLLTGCHCDQFLTPESARQLALLLCDAADQVDDNLECAAIFDALKGVRPVKLIFLGSNKTLVTIGNDEYYFSYNTCVAIRNEEGNFRIKSPSTTTSRHIKEMGVSNFLIIPEKELAQYLPTSKLPPLQE